MVPEDPAGRPQGKTMQDDVHTTLRQMYLDHLLGLLMAHLSVLEGSRSLDRSDWCKSQTQVNMYCVWLLKLFLVTYPGVQVCFLPCSDVSTGLDANFFPKDYMCA